MLASDINLCRDYSLTPYSLVCLRKPHLSDGGIGGAQINTNDARARRKVGGSRAKFFE